MSYHQHYCSSEGNTHFRRNDYQYFTHDSPRSERSTPYIGSYCHSLSMAPKITSTTVNHHPTAPAVPLSRIGFYTLLAIVLAIIALFTPILLRGQSLRPQHLGSQLSRYFSSQTGPITTTVDTMSDVKLSPRDLKEWNQYVTKAGGRVIADMR
jgi:hypothetical protein